MAAVLTGAVITSTDVRVTDVTGATQDVIVTWSFLNTETHERFDVVTITPFVPATDVQDQTWWDDVFIDANALAVAAVPGSSSSATNPVTI